MAIKPTCLFCGEVSLSPSEVRLVVCTVPERSYFTFKCPKCGDEPIKQVSADSIRQLTNAKVVIQHWVIPAEALEEHTGDPLRRDDLLDFHESIDIVEELSNVAHLEIMTQGRGLYLA